MQNGRGTGRSLLLSLHSIHHSAFIILHSLPMTSVRLDHITKAFGDTVALDDINLDIGAGELFFLLGPSGCGKSTLLRLIAGLHEPTSGRLWFDDRDVTALGTEKRNAVMCFQSY